MAYRIVTDSCCDYPQHMYDELNLSVVNLSVSYKGQEYCSYSEEWLQDFFAGLREGEKATTSAVNPEGWAKAIEPALQAAGQIGALGHDGSVGVDSGHALVQTGALRIAQRDDGSTGLLGEGENLQDLTGLSGADSAGLDGVILRINIRGTAVDQAIAGDNAGIGSQRVQLNEAGFVQQQLDALTGGQLACAVDGSDLSCVTLKRGLSAFADKGKIPFHTHGFDLHIYLCWGNIQSTTSFQIRYVLSYSCCVFVKFIGGNDCVFMAFIYRMYKLNAFWRFVCISD